MGIISDQLSQIQQQIAQACDRSGRDPGKISLVAVSKTKPASAVLEALAEGQLIFGENRVQESRDKIPLVEAEAGSLAQWHLIGPLQRNKVNVAVKLFSMIHSLDSVELALDLSKRAQRIRPLPVLVQINVGRESQKNGFLPEQAPEAIRQMADLDGIQVQGLMTVPPVTPDPEGARPYFQALARLAEQIKALQLDGIGMDQLSMGMSHDYPVAVEEGATLIRVGSALFGARTCF
ncbi:MAG: YggS family pyridoxal phosphate-dependent enzyme [Magnetococcales bacterium]|nr:YggS family pyridoxal phosphate-dependent enzyme [Magnetococcales bacterium]